MKITIVSGFFLPVPPVAGGAMEKTWWRLAREFATRGHHVTLISRCWQDWPIEELSDGVRILRVRGFDHRRRRSANLLLDAIWGLRVHRRLPAADILVTNTVALPIWVRPLRAGAGRLVVNLNRFPKGQLRWYRDIARVQAASATIAAAAVEQAPRLANVIRVTPNPIECRRFAAASQQRARASHPVTIGYFGRIHPEKGLQLLIEAARRLNAQRDLPEWRLELRGPVEIAQGGGGPAFARELDALAEPLQHAGRYARFPPEFDAERLARAFANLDVFCYPTVAEKGEALPVAVLEAMAAARPVVVTALSCFREYVQDHETGRLLASWHEADAAERLAGLLASLVREPETRARLGGAAQAAVASLDHSTVADTMLADFQSILHGPS
jgi:glycosyltransferase involved in cell wall biosynthesis